MGFGLGVSVLTCGSCDDADSSLAVDFNLGWFLNPRLALHYDYSTWFDSEDFGGGSRISLSVALHAIGAQYWLGPKLWLKGGAGVAVITLGFSGENSDGEDFDDDITASGAGFTGAVGFDVFTRGAFALDLSGRISNMTINEGNFTTFNFVAGARWH